MEAPGAHRACARENDDGEFEKLSENVIKSRRNVIIPGPIGG